MKKFEALSSLGFLALLLSVVPAHAQSARPNGVEATSTPLIRPHGLAYDTSGNYYIADTDQNVIRKVSTAGIITTVAGTGEQGYAGDGGPATAAILDSPAGVAVDSSGNIYIADTHNNVVREVVASSGNIATIAGTGVAGFSGEGSTATAAMLSNPTAIAVDSNGNVYVADTNNHRIREIIGTTINTVAGDGEQFYSGDSGKATAAGLDSPNGVAVDSAFNIYIGDTHNQRVRMVSFASGNISTIAGSGVNGYNGEGTATAVELARPRGVAVDTSGKVYVADSDNNLIRSISGGNLNTIAGTSLEGFGGDGGPATSAWLDTPDAVAIKGTSLLFSDTENNLVRALNDGTVNSTAGTSPSTETVVITGPVSVAVGSGTLTATFSNGGNTGTGLVTLYDGLGSSPAVVGSAALTGNAAPVSTGALAVGTHYLIASYAGDTNNPAITSGVFVLVVTPGPAQTLHVTAPPSATAGSAFNVTVTAADSGGNTAAGYTGTVHFTSSDSGAGSSLPGNYTFTAGDNGVHTFAGVTLVTAGNQTVTATDTVNASIAGTSSTVLVSILPPQLTSPAPGTTLRASTGTFRWTAAGPRTSYLLKISTLHFGASDVFGGNTSATSILVPTIPTNGAPLYVQLSYKVNGAWVAINYTYTEEGSPTPPAIITPAPSSTLSGSSETFNWSAGAGPTAYILKVGTTHPGASDVFTGSTTSTSLPVPSGIPANGGTLYVTLEYQVGATWTSINYTYTESGGGPNPPAMLNPVPGSTLTGSSVTFNWNAGAGDTTYRLRVGTTGVGSSDIYLGNPTTALSAPVSGLPINGQPVYVTLGYKVGGVWHAISFTYTAQ